MTRREGILSLARQFDTVCGSRLTELLGPGWDLSTVKDRCSILHRNGTDTIYLDGVPILRFGPLQFTTTPTETSYTCTATRKVERL